MESRGVEARGRGLGYSQGASALLRFPGSNLGLQAGEFRGSGSGCRARGFPRKSLGSSWACRAYRVTSLISNSPPPQGHHMALSMVVLSGPRGAQFLMSEVTL